MSRGVRVGLNLLAPFAAIIAYRLVRDSSCHYDCIGNAYWGFIIGLAFIAWYTGQAASLALRSVVRYRGARSD